MGGLLEALRSRPLGVLPNLRPRLLVEAAVLRAQPCRLPGGLRPSQDRYRGADAHTRYFEGLHLLAAPQAIPLAPRHGDGLPECADALQPRHDVWREADRHGLRALSLWHEVA